MYFHNRSWQRLLHFPLRTILRTLTQERLLMIVLSQAIASLLTDAGYYALTLRNSGGKDFDRLASGVIAPKDYRLLWMGRPDVSKGFFLAVEVLQLLRAQNPVWRFDVYGSDGVGLPLHNGIFYHGFVKGEAKLAAFKEGGIFILPSDYADETQPLSIIEAFAAGLPVVASNMGSIREMVENEIGRGGIILTPNQRTAADYAQAVTTCFKHFDEFSRAARDIYRKIYSHEVFVSEVRRHFSLLSAEDAAKELRQ